MIFFKSFVILFFYSSCPEQISYSIFSRYLISIAVGIKHRCTIKIAILFKLQIEKSYLVYTLYSTAVYVDELLNIILHLFVTDIYELLDFI